jgi:hypothetical protein
LGQYNILHQECKLQAKNEKIIKKSEVLTGLVKKLLCSQQAKTRTATAASESAVAKPSEGAHAIYSIFFHNFVVDEMCGREFVAAPGNEKTVHCYISAGTFYR